MNTCLTPVPVEDPDGDQRWMSIHNRFVLDARSKDPEVVFVGDSIVQAMQHTDVWNEWFVPLHCLNFGIHRDRLQNVLWRVQNGELDNMKPKVVVLHVGTNNHDNSPEEIIEGIVEIVNAIKTKLDNAYIVIPTLLPRGQYPNPLRDRMARANELIKSKVSHLPRVEVVPIDNGFVQSDGTISHHDMYDYLLLTDAGCRKAFEPVYEMLLQLLGENEIEIEIEKELTLNE